jgi:hypothetical protein
MRAFILRPSLFARERGCKANLRFRSSRMRLEIDKADKVWYALINGTKMLPRHDGAIHVPATMLSGKLDIKVFSRWKLTPDEPRVGEQRFSNNGLGRSGR